MIPLVSTLTTDKAEHTKCAKSAIYILNEMAEKN